VDLSASNFDTCSVSDKPCNAGGAISVWRGGQGGAFVPPSDHKFLTEIKTRNLAFSRDMTGKLPEDPFPYAPAEAIGVQTVTKKRRVLAQVNILL